MLNILVGSDEFCWKFSGFVPVLVCFSQTDQESSHIVLLFQLSKTLGREFQVLFLQGLLFWLQSAAQGQRASGKGKELRGYCSRLRNCSGFAVTCYFALDLDPFLG